MKTVTRDTTIQITRTRDREMLIDSHAHLTSNKYEGLPTEEIIALAKEKGIEKIVNIAIGEGIQGIHKLLEQCNKFENLYPVAGFHPHEAFNIKKSDFDELLKVLDNKEVRAIGEIGLDYHYNFSPKNSQIMVFGHQLEIATCLKKNVVIHCRESHSELKEILSQFKKVRAVIHCFSGNYKDAKYYIDNGHLISIPGIITFPKNSVIEEVVKKIPLEYLLLETDSPYLAPVPHRGLTNQPAYLLHVAEKVAEITKKELAYVAEITSKNTTEFFNL